MFLVFAPMPPCRRVRSTAFEQMAACTVGAAGMIVEVFIAPWLVCMVAVEQDLVRAFAYQCNGGRWHFDGIIQWQSAFAV
jgi:hypothetical protein